MSDKLTAPELRLKEMSKEEREETLIALHAQLSKALQPHDSEVLRVIVEGMLDVARPEFGNSQTTLGGIVVMCRESKPAIRSNQDFALLIHQYIYPMYAPNVIEDADKISTKQLIENVDQISANALQEEVAEEVAMTKDF